MQLMMKCALDQKGKQFIFLTPQDMRLCVCVCVWVWTHGCGCVTVCVHAGFHLGDGGGWLPPSLGAELLDSQY